MSSNKRKDIFEPPHYSSQFHGAMPQAFPAGQAAPPFASLTPAPVLLPPAPLTSTPSNPYKDLSSDLSRLSMDSSISPRSTSTSMRLRSGKQLPEGDVSFQRPGSGPSGDIVNAPLEAYPNPTYRLDNHGQPAGAADPTVYVQRNWDVTEIHLLARNLTPPSQNSHKFCDELRELDDMYQLSAAELE